MLNPPKKDNITLGYYSLSFYCWHFFVVGGVVAVIVGVVVAVFQFHKLFF